MKKLILYSLLVCTVGGFAGCKKWLDLKPQDGIVGDEFWRTKEQVDGAVIGMYTSIQASTELFFMWGEARTDMVAPAFRANQDEQDIVNLNVLPNNRYVNWRTFYETINYCNTIIQLAPGVQEKDNTFSEAHLNTAVGQALAVRSLMYFYLVRSFRDVPLKLNATVSDEDLIPIPKSSGDTVLSQIVSDLKKAESFLPATYGNTTIDKGRITRYGVNTLLADVYLWMNRYNECVTECNKVINSGNFGLVSGPEFFNSVFIQGNSNESIFELQFDFPVINPFFNMHPTQNRRWSAAPHLTDIVYGIDAVNVIPRVDVRGEYTSYRPTDYTIWKYVGASANGSTLRSQDQSNANWIFYRYADILLMKAEAINQLDQPLEASRLVNVIRNRANAVNFKSMDSTSKGGMTTFILEERQREFAFEGKRWYDVLRNAKRNNYEGLHYILDMASISLPSDRRQAAFNKLKDKNSHYFPIFFYEIQTNKLLEQNPFYK